MSGIRWSNQRQDAINGVAGLVGRKTQAMCMCLGRYILWLLFTMKMDQSIRVCVSTSNRRKDDKERKEGIVPEYRLCLPLCILDIKWILFFGNQLIH